MRLPILAVLELDEDGLGCGTAAVRGENDAQILWIHLGIHTVKEESACRTSDARLS